MRLKKLKIENYRCYEQLELEFNERLTVIIGNNSSGKTAVLESAVVAIGTIFHALDGLYGISINRTDARRKVYRIGITEDIQPQYPVRISAEGEWEEKSEKKIICWSRTLNGETGNTTVKDAKMIIDLAKIWQNRLRAGDETLVLPFVAYYGTSRLWDYRREKKSSASRKNTRTNGYIDCLDGTANLNLMLNWFKKKTLEKYQKQEQGIFVQTELDIVYHAMEECYERITGYENIRIQYNLNTDEIDVYYTDKKGVRMCIPVNQLSDGYKNTISLIADISYRMAILNPQLQNEVTQKTPGIVLIDEVDLHLHPEWQHRILGDLQAIFPKLQFIVSTHAPAVISSVRSENLIILKDYQPFAIATQIYGNDANSILNEIMNVPERTPEIARLFEQFYNALSNQCFEEAESILNKIDEERNYHDKEVASCRVKLKLERIRGGLHG